MKVDPERIGLPLIGALLLHHGELSIGEIRALPFFSDTHHADAAIWALINNFDVELCSRRTSSWPIPRREDVIRLKK